MKNAFRNVSLKCNFSIVLQMLISFLMHTLIRTHVESVSVYIAETAKEGRTGELPWTEGDEVTEKARCGGGWGAPGEFQLASILPFPDFLSLSRKSSLLWQPREV